MIVPVAVRGPVVIGVRLPRAADVAVRAAHLRASLETSTTPAPSTNADVLAALAEAVQHRRVITFDYTGKDGSVTSRRVEPHRHVHHNLRWYLLAWDTDKDDWRVFRIDRITRLHTTTTACTPRPLPADTALDYLRQGLNKDRTRVVLTVDAPLPAVVDAFKHQEAEVVALDDRRTEVVLMTDTWQWLPLDLAFLDADFTVHEPPGLRAALQTFGARLLHRL